MASLYPQRVARFNPNQHFLQQVKNLDNIDQVLYQVWRFGCVS